LPLVTAAVSEDNVFGPLWPMFYVALLGLWPHKAREGFAMTTTLTPNPTDSNHPFHAIAESFLQADGLPFADVLTAESVERVFRDHDALFGQNDIYSTQIVLWAFLGQALRDGKGASCAAAVEDIATHMCQSDRPAPCGDTGDYCRARAKLDLSAVRHMTTATARRLEADAPEPWLWKY
jgi:hypothetical protein